MSDDSGSRCQILMGGRSLAMWRRTLTFLSIVGALIGFPPVAFASPPDPLWPPSGQSAMADFNDVDDVDRIWHDHIDMATESRMERVRPVVVCMSDDEDRSIVIHAALSSDAPRGAPKQREPRHDGTVVVTS